jgi:transposase
MIAVTAQTRIWVAREPADFRCGIDGLAKVCRTVLKSDPFICVQKEYVAGFRRQLLMRATGVTTCELVAT